MSDDLRKNRRDEASSKPTGFTVEPYEPKKIEKRVTGLEPVERNRAHENAMRLFGFMPDGTRHRRKEKPEPKKTEMQFGREEDFIGFMQEIAANASGSPLYDDALVEELGKFLKSHFDRARLEHMPPVPKRKYVPRKDEIIPFLREVWGEWLDAAQLTMPILKDADHRAYQALQNWTRSNELPEGMRIKSASDVTSEFLERDYFRRDEIFRASSAMGRRGLKN